jgi:uncharacterized protein (TIGR03118 family)
MLSRLFPARSVSAKPTRRSLTFRPQLETMEDRQLPSATFYQPVSLVSDQAGHARIQDTSLVNAWGIAVGVGGGNFWVSDNATGLATVYFGDVNGTPFQRNNLVVSIPGGAPTGQLFNTTTDFIVSDGAGHSGPAFFIFASESGNITGWNPGVPPPVLSHQAQLGATVDGAIFKGIALANNGSGNFLYAADFHNGVIDAFDSSFTPTTLAGSFTDPNIPAGFAPFNIQNLGGTLYVTYAKQDAEAEDDLAGPGNGFVDAFDANGNFLRRVATQGVLNSPWGLALAPNNFGPFSNDLLVGSFGDGTIHAFNPTTGALVGTLSTGPNHPIVIDGLWGLTFGNGVTAGASNTLYFAAGPDDESHGLFGKITAGSNVNDQLRRLEIGSPHAIPHSSLVRQVIELHNNRTAITGPITLFISNIPAGVTLLNATGQTPQGAFITIPASSLGKNRDLQVTLVFDNPAHVSLSLLRHLQVDVFAGRSPS